MTAAGPPQIAKLGHVALVTPDLETSLGFWRDVVGLEEVERHGDTAFLRAWGDREHHTLSLRAGEAAAVDHVAWRTKRPEDVDAFAERLDAGGCEVTEVPAGAERGQGRAVRFASPQGHRLELYYDVEKPPSPAAVASPLRTNSTRAWERGISPRRIDHVNLVTTDAGACCTWLGDQLGFEMRELIRLADGTLAGGWMAVTNLVHDVAVMADAAAPPDRFHHLAYCLDNWQDVLRAADILREHRVVADAGPGKHGITQAVYLYVKDPGSGHRLELFAGGYLVFDPDWEPIVWTEEELADGMSWWGPDLSTAAEMATTTSF
ncbi:MAG: 2,3-dihydroxybiphenyl 1,2-dioxygenase [Actinobacteria bacterium]|nr:2,3-dihydroxybiphenyl 1,2-dioxygenase [Actinomycetota bacterium]